MSGQTGPANATGDVRLFFVDSGPVTNSNNYATIFILPGMANTINSFIPLIPLAGPTNLRLVLVNRRGYPGSTAFSDDDLKLGMDGNSEFFSNIGKELLYFMSWFIREHSLPDFDAETRSGGVVLLGWSLSGACVTTTLDFPDNIQGPEFDAVKRNYRTALLYDPPCGALGIPYPPLYANPKITQSGDIFAEYVTSYYDHPKDTRDIALLDHREKTDRKSMDLWDEEEIKKNNYWEGMKVDVPALLVPSALREHSSRALLETPIIFPQVNVVVLSCTQTVAPCLWGCWEIEKLHAEAKAQNPRALTTIVVDANHFLHRDEPVKFIQVLVKALNP